MDTYTDPELIRDILAYADRVGSVNKAAAKYGFAHKTIGRWKRRRAESGGVWPTDQHMVEWRQGPEERREYRARAARQKRSYRNRRYLNGGRKLCVSAIGTRRRLQALHALGHRMDDIGDRLGVSRQR